MINIGSKIKIPEHVSFTVMDNGAVILNIRTGKYLGLNEVGTRMYQALGEHGTADKVIEVLLQEFDVPEDLLREDLWDLLNELEAKSLVDITDN